MFDELKPKSVHAFANELGADPAEIIRLKVFSESDLTHLELMAVEVERIRQFSGIEALCERIPPTEHPLTGHRWVAPLLSIMLSERRFGENTVRMDNLWRGLPDDDQSIVKNVVHVLVDEGLLVTYGALQGLQVSIHPEAVDAIQALVDGETIPDSLAFLWKA